MITGCECNPGQSPFFCRRHGCQKTRLWHALCQSSSETFQSWEQGCGPGQPGSSIPQQSEAPKEPGLLRKAANFSKAAARHVADGGRQVSEDIYQRRLNICERCPSCDLARMVCRDKNCGCRLLIKARWASEDCPAGLWAQPPTEEHASDQIEMHL